ncbi:PREDICTED: translocon-associated protein subunit gamma isoform X4 [Colobus angolensis palliatus]|uniref:translocon-associated protein subunit gamma isoform X4 n=1 Tax=Colobus angolensis palliatus TaxID=336983 RepID=UPI0005F4D3C4|nr:PREDICTED: translocon-associated protein subunit gamma isoform X4 [Colobus angolensis palliatus]
MAPKGSSKQQSEEDLLLQDFSRNLSAKSSALFFGNAFIVSAIPIWLYWRIWHMDLIQSAVLYSVMTLVSTYLVAFAYKNVKFVLKHKVAQKREDAVSKEVTRKLSEADNRKMSRKEKDERQSCGRRMKLLIMKLQHFPSSITTLCSWSWSLLLPSSY